MSFNPNAPTMFGAEWPVTRQGGVRLAAADDAAAAGFSSAATESVTSVDVYLSHVVSGAALTLDIFDAADLPQSSTTYTYRPNADDTITDLEDEGGATTSLYASVDEATLDTADYITNGGDGSGAIYQCQVGSAAHGAGTISAVRVMAWVAAPSSSNDVRLGFEIGGANFVGDSHTVVPADGTVLVSETFATNPDTGAAWTQADVQALDATDAVRSRFAASSEFRIYQLWVEVDTVVAPEASGTCNPTEDGWCTVTLDSTWSKASGTDYVAVLRKTNSAGAVVWNLLDSGEACPHVSHVSYLPTRTDGLLSALGDSATAAHAVVFDVSGTASADSQPYATLTKEPVYSGRTVQQEFTPSSSVTVGNLAATIARQAATVDGDLTGTVYRRSDDTQIGGTVTITDDDVATSVRKLRQVVAAMASTGSVTSGTQYYIEWSSDATSGAGWTVAVLDTEGEGDSAGYGSTTNAATVASTEDTSADVAGWVAQVPAAVADLAVAESGSDETLSATLSWTATGTSGFDRYEIRRDGTLIATIGTNATDSFTDYRAVAGTEHSYEIRQRLTDGRVSAWSSSVTFTLSDHVRHRLVSNHDPSINLLLRMPNFDRTRYEDRHEYSPLGADHVRVHRGSQQRGAEMVWVVNCGVDGSAEGDDVYADLEAAVGADVPLLTLLTSTGDSYDVTVEWVKDRRETPTFGRVTLRARTVSFVPVEVA